MADESIVSIIGQPALDEVKAILAGLDAIAAKQKEINAASRGAAAGMSGAQNTRQVAAATSELERIERRLADAVSEGGRKAAEAKERFRQLALEQRNASQYALAAEGSLNQLRAQLVQLNRQYDNMTKAQRENANVGGVLQARIRSLHAEVSALEQATGRHQRNVGNYASAFNGLGFSVAQLTREMPAFANSLSTGFMALSNNLPILFDELKKINSENAKLREEGQKTTPVLKQLAASLFSWQTLLSVGVTLLTVYGEKIFESFTKGDEAAQDFAKSLAEIDKTINQTAGAEIGKLQTLVAITEDVTQSIDDRKRAAAEMQKLYPSILGNLSQEAIMEGKAKDAINKTTEAILAKARAQAASDKIAKFAEKELDVREQLFQKEQELIKVRQKAADARETSADSDAQMFEGIGFAERAKGLEKEVAGLKTLLTALEAGEKKYEDYIKKQNAASKGLFIDDTTSDPKVVRPKSNKAEERALERRLELLKELRESYADFYRMTTTVVADNEMEEQRDAKLKMHADQMTEVIAGIESSYVQSLTQIERDYQNGLYKTAEDYAKATEDLEKETNVRKLQAHIASWKYILSTIELTKEQRLGIERKIGAAELAIVKANNKGKEEEDKKSAEKRLAERKKVEDKLKELALATISAVGDVSANLMDAELMKLEAKGVAIDKNKEKEINAINATTLSQEEKVRKIAELEQKAALEKEAIEKQQLALRQRAARFERDVTIVEIIAKTALAVAEALPNIPLALGVGALGALQLATVVSRPIPQYAEGTLNHPGGPAIMGERGRELVRENGKTWLTADRATLYENLSRGAQVIPHEQVMAMAGRDAGLMAVMTQRGPEIDLKNLLHATEENTRAVRSLRLPKTDVHVHGGWDAYVRRSTSKNW